MELRAAELRFEYLPGWAAPPAGGGWSDVAHASVAADGRVVLLNRGPRPLQVFAPDGSFAGDITVAGLGLPHGSCFDAQGRLLLTDERQHTVLRLADDGTVDLQLGTPGVAADTGYRRLDDIHAASATVSRSAGPFNRPTGVAVSAGGDILVTDGYGNARLHRFSATGEWLASQGRPGARPGEFRLPHGIAIDAADRAWVADWGNGRLQVFGADGAFCFAVDGFEGPADIAFDADGVVFVAEEEWRVSVLDPDGALMARWDSRALPLAKRPFIAPHSIDCDRDGHLYIGEVAAAYRGIDRGAQALGVLRRLA